MKTEEKQLFWQLCRFQSEHLDSSLLRYASPEVLGHLFFNRMQGIAYGVLKKHNALERVNREFRHSLQGAYEQNIEQNRSFMQGIALLSETLRPCSDRYAMLKGAYLCGAYPDGYRTANDVDLLVRPEDVTRVGEALTKAGFRQGHVRGGEFAPAGRREIIESKMLRGETVPYILEIGLPKMRFLEVDINFSLDYKNGDSAVLNAMLERVTNTERERVRIPVLDRCDFLIHLCCHLYKEAAALPWVEMKRDMTLYKYADVYMLLNRMSKADAAEWLDRARELELEKICAFAVLQTEELFAGGNPAVKEPAEAILRSDPDFLHRVISPSEKKTYIYRTRNIADRFFMSDRAAELTEVSGV